MTAWTIDTLQTTRWLQDMVRINSINPDLAQGGAGEEEIARWLVTLCQNLGLETHLQYAAPNRPNVIACWRGSGGGKSLLLTGHTDTVGIENMTGDPLDGRIEGERLYGRGSYDMKGGLAATLGAVAALKSGGFQPQGDVILGFVCDEEYASIGMDALVQDVHADAALLVEPTDGKIVTAHKGFVWLTLETRGRAAHGSLYTQGVDAIAHMGRLLNEIERMENETFPQREHPLLGRPSVHASLIQGGLGWSTYPDSCTLKVEHRILPDETPADVTALWNRAIEQLQQQDEQFQATVTLDLERPGYEIDRDAPIVATLHEAVTQENTIPTYGGIWAWMDSAILGRAGIPTVIYGTGGEGAHAAVEFVSLRDVFHCAAVYGRVVQAWCEGRP
jgi:acetylornithine deacetylase